MYNVLMVIARCFQKQETVLQNKQTNKQLEGKVSLARFIEIFNMPYGGLALPRSTDLWMNVLKSAEQHWWKN